MTEKILHCSFCGKSNEDATKLIAGPTVYICNECVVLCEDIMRTENPHGPRAMVAADLGVTVMWRVAL